jgi:DNA-binding response OmpR family regulator
MKLFLRTKRVEWKGEFYKLSSLQILFLIPLIEAKGKPVKSDQIGAFIFPSSHPENYKRMVAMYAKRIRIKIPGMLGARKRVGYFINQEICNESQKG